MFNAKSNAKPPPISLQLIPRVSHQMQCIPSQCARPTSNYHLPFKKPFQKTFSPLLLIIIKHFPGNALAISLVHPLGTLLTAHL